MARCLARTDATLSFNGSKRPLRFAEGTILFDSGHPCRRVYLLRSGYVQLLSGREAVLDLLVPGTFFGQQSLLPAARAAVIAKAVSPATASVFAKSEVLRRMSEDRRFALALLKSLVRRLDGYEEKIRDFVVEPAQTRLVRLLLRLAPPRPAQGWVRLPCPLSNPDLARMIGTTRERVSHFLNDLQRRGWVRREQTLWIQREGLAGMLRPGAAG